MDASASLAIQGGAGLNTDIRGETMGTVSGKIPKIVHQGWLKKKGNKYSLTLYCNPLLARLQKWGSIMRDP